MRLLQALADEIRDDASVRAVVITVVRDEGPIAAVYCPVCGTPVHLHQVEGVVRLAVKCPRCESHRGGGVARRAHRSVVYVNTGIREQG